MQFDVSRLFFHDPLSVFFLSVIALVSIPSAVYSAGYLKGGTSARKAVLAWALLAAFVASMAMVVTVNNILVFLVAWELMSLVSYFLVVFDTRHERSINAGMVYIVMTHIGTAFLIAAFAMIYKYAGSFDIIAAKNACLAMPLRTRDAVFLLLLIGFGTKAGIVPLHIWLPYAHPQAPSHISSIMSGVMIKTAIYGMIRFMIFMLGPGAGWRGTLMLALAAVTALVGIIYALMEKDIKRLLAYSSVENIGVILLGIGLSVLFFHMGMAYPAVLAMIAGLYHLVNHAIFKGLLFLCAGSIYKGSGTRDMEKLGGLIRRMPYTAAFFLVGAAAISSVPPLNGFVSEWLTLQAFFLGASNVAGGMKILLGVAAAVLALTGALAAACFVKAFGITFLALPRSRYSEGAAEAPLSMKAGMFFLSILAVVFGIAAPFIVSMLARIAGPVFGIDTSRMAFCVNNITLALQPGKGVYLSVPSIAAALAVFLLVGLAIYLLPAAKGRARVYNTWDCGYYRLDARNEYTATAFSKPFRIAFSFFLLPYRKTQKIRESFYHIASFEYQTHTTKVFRKYIYEPAITLIVGAARQVKRMQPGSIHLYISYIFAALILLVMFMNRF